MKTEDTMINALKWNNATAPHQQDQWNWYKDVARTLAQSTHGASSHLTKTLILSPNFRSNGQ